MAPRSHSGIDPQTHVHVLERLVTTTAEAVENIPIFLDLLDQPVKDATLRPFNMEKWKGLLHITFRLLRDQSIFSVSAAWNFTAALLSLLNIRGYDDTCDIESPANKDRRKPYKSLSHHTTGRCGSLWLLFIELVSSPHLVNLFGRSSFPISPFPHFPTSHFRSPSDRLST